MREKTKTSKIHEDPKISAAFPQVVLFFSHDSDAEMLIRLLLCYGRSVTDSLIWIWKGQTFQKTFIASSFSNETKKKVCFVALLSQNSTEPLFRVLRYGAMGQCKKTGGQKMESMPSARIITQGDEEPSFFLY